jgi:hypothetical protein
MRASLDQKANAVETRSGTAGPAHASLRKPETDTDEGNEAMRAPSLALLTLLAAVTPVITPALAQSPGNRGATSRQNEGFEYRNQNRNFEQRQTLENSAIRNQIQRAPLNVPPPAGPSFGPRR